MKQIDQYGQIHYTSDGLFQALYNNPDIHLEDVPVDDPEQFNNAVATLYSEIPALQKYQPSTISVEEFDLKYQANWHFPDEYKQMDIAKWCLEQCNTDVELQRVGEELLMFQDRNLLVLLRFLKYLVDTLRENNIVWGVGRGSSVASYVLFLIGIHKIDSIYFDLDVEEFLR